MSDVNKLILCSAGRAGRAAIKAAEETACPKVEQIKIELPGKTLSSVFDLSTEELGFFKYQGKIFPLVFPR